MNKRFGIVDSHKEYMFYCSTEGISYKELKSIIPKLFIEIENLENERKILLDYIQELEMKGEEEEIDIPSDFLKTLELLETIEDVAVRKEILLKMDDSFITGNATIRKNNQVNIIKPWYPLLNDPPEKYDWTYEYRKPKPLEYFMGLVGIGYQDKVSVNFDSNFAYGARHILRKL